MSWLAYIRGHMIDIVPLPIKTEQKITHLNKMDSPLQNSYSGLLLSCKFDMYV